MKISSVLLCCASVVALLLAASCVAPPAATGNSATQPAAATAAPVQPAPLAPAAAPGAAAEAAVAQPVRSNAAPSSTTALATAAAAPVELRTRHATFRRAGFDELPGWEQDDLVTGWPAFRSSCAALQKRDAWRELCAQSAAVPNNSTAIRAFFESRFTLMRILNSDASRDGEITGYFEPLLEGRRQPEGDFNVPVLGVPRDLYTLDWMTVPAAQRRSIVQVRPEGSNLVVVPTAVPGSAALDLRRFELDTKDRRLRIRVSRTGGALRAEPYPTRGELTALGLPSGVDAPVLAWVNDALALYAMQVQGSGRIRLADSTVLRVQYAEQNGHPFRPLRVVAKASDRIVTRGIASAAPAEADEFVLEEPAADAAAPAVEAESQDAVITRGLQPAARSAPSSGANQNAAANALVDELLSGKPKRAAAPIAPAPAVRPAAAPAAAPPIASSALPPPRAPSGRAGAKPAVEPALLASDPSYVFFKVAPDQRSVDGPPGALGVALTPGRSVAVDPRITPLGYPVFLAAPPPAGSSIDMRRLVFAQDTGGAIRGAVRADFFWGFGSDAGRLARGTRHRGQMWLLLPKTEVARLGNGGVVTRGVGGRTATGGECLVADEEFCQEPE